MPATATINIRLPEDLKNQGMHVLEREGVSVSELVRSLFTAMGKQQRIPSFSETGNPRTKDDIAEERREIMRSMVGILDLGDKDSDAYLDEIRAARLEKHLTPGVRQ